MDEETKKEVCEVTLIDRLQIVLKRVYFITDTLGKGRDLNNEKAETCQNVVTQAFDLILDIDKELNVIEEEVKRLK